MAKKEKLKNLSKADLLNEERDRLGFNLTSILGDSKLKIDVNKYKGIRDVNEKLLSQEEVKNMLIAAVVTKLEYRARDNGSFFYWVHLSDDWTSIKMYCSDKTFSMVRDELLVGRCVLLNVNIRNDFVTFDKCILMDKVPFRRGAIFVIHLPYGQWTTKIQELIINEVDRSIRRGSCQLFLRTKPYDVFIEPTYDLIDAINNAFGVRCSVENEEEFVWGKSNKLLKEMESHGY